MTNIKMNVKPGERFFRIIVGGILLVVVSYVPLNAPLTWLLACLGLILMLTGLAGWCPIYNLLKK